jgi:hypothetical protein
MVPFCQKIYIPIMIAKTEQPVKVEAQLKPYFVLCWHRCFKYYFIRGVLWGRNHLPTNEELIGIKCIDL